MVSSIVLGNFFSANGRSVLGGAGGSGLDTQALINGLLQAKAAPILPIQDKLSVISQQASALSQFQQLVTSFLSAADAVRNPPGVSNSSANGFAYTTASVASNTSVSASTYVSVGVATGVEPQDHTITYITQLAAATRQNTGNFTVADADTTGIVVASGAVDGQFQAGTFTLEGLNGGDDNDITIEVNDTLNSIAAKFNAVSGDSGIRATVIQVSSGNFQLSFSGTKTGASNAFNLAGAGTVTDATGVIAHVVSGSSGFATSQSAANAIFKLDGVQITSSTNTIRDVIDGVTFTLRQVTPDDPLNPPATPTKLLVTIAQDNTTAIQSINGFVNAYNSIRSFAAQQLATNADGTFAATAVLANNTTFRNLLTTITSEMAGRVSGLSETAYATLADVGITFDTQPKTQSTPEITNVLVVDSSKLSTALESNFSRVADLFQFTLNTSNPNLRVFASSKPLGERSFSVAINQFASQVTQGITVADADTAGIVVNSSPTAGQFLAGTITINGQNITLTTADTMNTIAGKFNAVVGTTGVAAAVSSAGTGQFKITFTSTPQTNKSNQFNLQSETVDPTGVFGEIDVTATGTYTATYGMTTVDLEADPTEGTTSVLLTAPDDSELAGLELIYGSDAAATITATITEGLGHTLYNIADAAADPLEGSIFGEIDALEKQDTDLRKQAQTINDQVTQYRDQLLIKFGALEQAISKVNQLLLYLNAQQLAQQASSNS